MYLCQSHHPQAEAGKPVTALDTSPRPPRLDQCEGSECANTEFRWRTVAKKYLCDDHQNQQNAGKALTAIEDKSLRPPKPDHCDGPECAKTVIGWNSKANKYLCSGYSAKWTDLNRQTATP
ncbi:Nn.00g116090.m01.CDS01 [Neocucurbitaria sp. VM-36]